MNPKDHGQKVRKQFMLFMWKFIVYIVYYILIQNKNTTIKHDHEWNKYCW